MLWTTLLTGLILYGQTTGTPRRPAPRGGFNPAAPAAPATPLDDTAEDEPAADDATEVDDAAAADDLPATRSPGSGRLVPIKPERNPGAAAKLLGAALTAPDAGGLAGERVPIVSVLSLSGRNRQLEGVLAYWRLAAAMAEHNFALDEYQRLASFLQPASDALAENAELDSTVADRVQIEQAASRARLREAELSAITAQHDLAVLLNQSPQTPLPLPADVPLVGTYRTYFAEIFRGRSPPARLQLIERTLPVLRQAIDTRASAVTAANDALQATIEAHNAGDVGLSAIATHLAELGRQRRAFMSDVRRYNDLIAEYALTVAGNSSAASIAPMLVKNPSSTAAPRSSSDNSEPGGVEKATFEDALDDSIPVSNEPTLAEPSSDEPTPADAGAEEPTPAETDLDEPTSAEEPTPAIPEDDGLDLQPTVDDSTALPPKTWREHVALRPSLAFYAEYLAQVDADAAAVGSGAALYSGLAELASTKRTHKLAAALHWDRGLPAQAGTPVTLQQYLQAAGGDRRDAVDAFWRTRELAARFQALSEAAGIYHDLVPAVLEKRQTTAGPRAMLDLRTAMLSSEAGAQEAHADLLAAQQRLTSLAGRSLDGAWLLPATPPHAGRYQLSAAAAGASRNLRRATVAVPTSHEALQDLATAVILADTARAQATDQYQQGQAPIEELLSSIEVQNDQTLAFLSTLTRYNQAIADYVAATSPPQMTTDQFVAALVVK